MAAKDRPCHKKERLFRLPAHILLLDKRPEALEKAGEYSTDFHFFLSKRHKKRPASVPNRLKNITAL